MLLSQEVKTKNVAYKNCLLHAYGSLYDKPILDLESAHQVCNILYNMSRFGQGKQI